MKLRAGQGLEAGPLLDPPADLGFGQARLGLGQHEREHLPLRRGEQDRLGVAGVDDRKALKGAAGLGDPHDHRPPVVHLEGAAEPCRARPARSAGSRRRP